MDDGRITRLWHWLAATRSRRTTLGAGVAALTALGLDARGVEILAKRKRRKKRKKKKPAAPTCAELCGSDCTSCVYRADAPALCGDLIKVACSTPCGSDNDCVVSPFPYCLSAHEERATGQVFPVCDGSGSFCGTIFTACQP